MGSEDFLVKDFRFVGLARILLVNFQFAVGNGDLGFWIGAMHFSELDRTDQVILCFAVLQ